MKGIQIIIECSLKIMISLYHYSSRKRTPTPLSLSGFPSPGLGFFFIFWPLSLSMQFSSFKVSEPPLRDLTCPAKSIHAVAHPCKTAL